MNKPKGLGRGLDALLGSDNSARKDATAMLPVDAIRPGKYQPRTHMDEKALNELASLVGEGDGGLPNLFLKFGHLICLLGQIGQPGVMFFVVNQETNNHIFDPRLPQSRKPLTHRIEQFLCLISLLRAIGRVAGFRVGVFKRDNIIAAARMAGG